MRLQRDDLAISAFKALRLGIVVTLVMTGLAPARASADDSDAAGVTQLETVVVEGERLSEYAPADHSAATRLELSPRETPQSISVVTRSQMDDFGLDSLNEVLGNTAGVNVEQIETDRNYYTVRGFDVTNFQRDGLGLPLPYGIQNGDIDTAIYERIEVLRGANGLMSSTGNPSATVNFVRKRPTAAAQGEVRLSVGSWDSHRVDLDLSGPLTDGGGIRGRAVAAWQDDESYLDRYSRTKQVAYGVVETDLGPATRLALGTSYQRNEPRSPLWGALPLYYTDGTPTDYDVSTSTAADWSYWISEDTRAFAEVSHAFANGWSLKSAVNYEKTADDTQLFYVYGTPDRETGEGLYAYPSDYEGRFSAQYADVYAAGPLDLWGRRHNFVVGTNWAKGNNEEQSWYGNDVGTALPPLETWDGRYPKPAFDAYSDGSDFDYRRGSVYANLRWNLADRVKVMTGANRSQVKIRGVGYGAPKNSTETRTTPFAGAVLDLSAQYAWYASYGEIFSPQTELDIDNRVLDPVTGSNLETGLKAEWFDGRLNASAAVFQTRQDNLAEYAGFDTDSGRSYYAGVDAKSAGYEFEIAGSIMPGWQVTGGYTALQVEDDDGDDARTYVPRRLLRLSTTTRVPGVDGLKLGASLRWQSEIDRQQGELDPDGNEIVTRQDAYALLGVMASYGIAERWTARLSLDNLTDEKYIQSLYWAQGYYGPSRNGSLTLSYRF